MTVEELMAERRKVIGPYPSSPYHINDIIDFSNCRSKTLTQYQTRNEFGDTIMVSNNAPQSVFDNYPNLFKRLYWWEYREVEDMPLYLRFGEFDKPHAIYKVAYYQLDKNEAWSIVRGGEYHLPFTSSCKPATESEYLTYINNSK